MHFELVPLALSPLFVFVLPPNSSQCFPPSVPVALFASYYFFPVLSGKRTAFYTVIYRHSCPK
jgi:hypothetical protein